MESSGVPSGVRKGAWTLEEDTLLRKWIEKHGEGKWHQVPLKAGLNRCRKSCRLRWLNYLRPNIKREGFVADEVDLMIRLHKLLGNRWSLIAGRLPGRTANDVKNYWNTHLVKKPNARRVERKIEAEKTKIETKIIKPRPRTFAKNLPWLKAKETIIDNNESINSFTTSSPISQLGFDETQWLENLLVDKETESGTTWSTDCPDVEPMTDLWAHETVPGAVMASDSLVQEGHNGWRDFYIDVDLWELLNDQEQAVM